MADEKILIVEDEKPLVKILKYNLEKENYRVASALNGEEGLAVFEEQEPDLVILDVMLPKVNGFEFCKTIRKRRQTPILMLTARKEEVDRVLGLELGADDYLTKPFSVRELLARVKAILRRTSANNGPRRVQAGNLQVDLERFEIRVKGKLVVLSPREFEFLKYLIEADGKVLTRDQLLEKVWGSDKSFEIDIRTIDQHIARMREKLGSEGERVATIKNVGYRIRLN